MTPADPVDSILARQGITKENSSNYNDEYDKQWVLGGFNLPLFYFSIVPTHYNNTAAVYKKNQFIFHQTLRSTSLSNNEIDQLYHQYSGDLSKLDSLHLAYFNPNQFHFPSFRFNGFQNQFHCWLSKVVKFDFGNSIRDGRPVANKILHSLSWTIALLIWSLILVFSFAVPAALFSGYAIGGWFDKIYRPLTLILYSIPSFWLATMVLVFFTTNEYHVKIFNSSVVVPNGDIGFLNILFFQFNKLAPALFCLVLGDLAYLSMLIRSNAISEMSNVYFLTSISKGLSRWKATLFHIFPNILIPLITLVFGSIPLALGGSLIVELVFSIPGMGRLLYDSIYLGDWSVVYAIVLLMAVITSLSYLLSDLFTNLFNPTIKRFSDESN